MPSQTLEKIIGAAIDADVRVVTQEGGLLYVSTPFAFSDGDTYPIYLHRSPTGGFRISDMGETLMHLSYDDKVPTLREGARGRKLYQILAESGLRESRGEFYLDTSADHLGASIVRFGEAIAQIIALA